MKQYLTTGIGQSKGTQSHDTTSSVGGILPTLQTATSGLVDTATNTLASAKATATSAMDVTTAGVGNLFGTAGTQGAQLKDMPASSTGISTTSAPLESGLKKLDTMYPPRGAKDIAKNEPRTLSSASKTFRLLAPIGAPIAERPVTSWIPLLFGFSYHFIHNADRNRYLKMSTFLNLAKEGLDAYSKSHSDVSKTGGQEYNSPHHSGQSSGYDRPQFDHDEVIKNAEKHGSGASNLFATALGYLGDNKNAHEEPLNDDEVTRAHDKLYNQNDASGLSSQLLGSAAALEVLKKFTGGGSSSHGSSHGGNSQSDLISMAMAEATKLFEKTGGKASGGKQDAVNGAAMTIMKLLVQSKFSGAGTIGGKDSGGLGSLFSLVGPKITSRTQIGLTNWQGIEIFHLVL
ncbi:hypothetical protein AN958_06635 [Leucoagaricus sp. SymC.cos]|nr:hypothetical protein AN958_06635 [Leucoagaricus sp. SymC.cos]